MPTPVIVGAARTAIGRSFKGALVNTPPETLITTVLPEVVRRSGVDPAEIDDIVFAESHYGGGDLARYAADATGLSHVPGQSVNRHCAGSLTAIGNASAQIGSGMERVLIAGGVQSLSMTPLTNWRIPGPELKFEERWMPPTHVETPDAPAKDMSITVGWNTAQSYGITREELDEFGLMSHQRAAEATDQGYFTAEIVPLNIKLEDGSADIHDRDEGIRAEASLEGMQSLNTLREGGVITAGTASQISDGAAAVMIANADAIARYNLPVRARIKALAVVGSDPVIMLEGPIPATRKVLEKAGLSIDDIDLYEVNEAFGSVPLAWAKALGADMNKLNVNGGAQALGHPLGGTGAKLMTTLVHELERRQARYGLVAICEGGGTANAMIIERMDSTTN